jgi:hypothetical protein
LRLLVQATDGRTFRVAFKAARTAALFAYGLAFEQNSRTVVMVEHLEDRFNRTLFADHLDNERVFIELVINEELAVDGVLLHGSPFLVQQFVRSVDYDG